MVPPLETPRLFLRPLALDDALQIQRIFPQWEVVEFLAAYVPWPYPEDGALTYVREVALPAMTRSEEWHWTLRLKSHPDQLIGCIGLFASPTNNRGFWLDPAWHRRGLMTEAANAVTDFWFNSLGFTVMRVPKAIANTGSRRISEHQGMRLVATEHRPFVSGLLPSEIWEITAEEWRAKQNPR